MPPKPQSVHKPSNAPKDAPDPQTIKVDPDTIAMPPPPVPAPSTGILEPEMTALSTCLKNATIRTGQILQFYADVHHLHIERHASAPPRSLQAALGRELEKYDQLCDSVEAQLLRAISVLQRDLQREKLRIQNAEREAAAAAAAAAAEAEAVPVHSSPETSLKALAASGSTESIATSNDTAGPSTNQSPAQGSTLPGRRPSAISISSLNRPTFPLKLDLSASSLRLSADEASFLSSGLHSPVTLAPKSARPTDYDIMAAFASSATEPGSRVDIDLTLPETSPDSMNIDLNSSLGNSADKPIELDMEGMETMDIDKAMSDLFGDSTETTSNDANAVVDDLFSPVVDNSGPAGDSSTNKDNGNFLAAHDIFASLGAGHDSNTARSDNLTVPSGVPQTAPSPGTLLASFSHQPLNADGPSSSGNPPTLTEGEPSFDLGNLDLLFTADNSSDMNLVDSLWTMDGADASGSAGGDAGATSGDSKPKS